jgi:hypothetical protein
MFERDLKCFRRAFAFVGPMFGNPSRMNRDCSFLDLRSFEARKERGFGDLFARTEISFAVSFSFLEKRMGTL